MIGIFWKDQPRGSAWLLVFPLLIALAQCEVWWRLIRSYREISSVRYTIIGELEERLPAAIYGRAELDALARMSSSYRFGSGRTMNLEQWTPVLFGLVYLTAFVVSVVAQYLK